MKIKVLGSAVDDAHPRHFTASYLIGDSIAIDAGSIGLISSIEAQKAIKHVFLSHPHLDHLASLPIFLDNVYELGPECPTLYCNDTVRESLIRDFFNDRVWPDLVLLSQEESPFLRVQILSEHSPVVVDDIQITAVELNHVTPTMGFIIEDSESAVAIVSDTSPTSKIWEVARANPKLKAVLLESAFPNSMTWLAEKSKHLTPALFGEEVKKLGRDVPIIAVHIKPSYYDEVVEELLALGLGNFEIGEPNRTYDF